MRRALPAVVLLAVSLSVLSAQSQPRHTTNAAALAAFPGYFHQRAVTMVGTLVRSENGRIRLADAPALHIVYNGKVPEGPAEIRGEFWDLGRMHADDPRFATYDPRTFGIDPDAGWPRSGQVTAIIATTVDPALPPLASSIRAMVLYPTRYLDQKVTITGQFTGRNLLGDLPDAPGRSQFDFVLRSADAAIWVTNLRPRGRDFELSLDTRVDTGRWIQVTGTLQQGRGLQWLNAEGSRVALVGAPALDLTASAAPPVPVFRPPAPEVVFSAPTQEEGDVPQAAPVRIQFSRDLDAATLKDHIKVRYLAEEARNLGEPDVPVAKFTYQYLAANRVLEIKFTEPLLRYRTIKVDLLEGILGTDKQALVPWTLSFLTGGAL